MKTLTLAEVSEIVISRNENYYYNSKNLIEIKKIIDGVKEYSIKNPNHPIYIKEYLLSIQLVNKEVINIKVIKTKNSNAIMILLNQYKGEYYEVGYYSNNKLLNILENIKV